MNAFRFLSRTPRLCPPMRPSSAIALPRHSCTARLPSSSLLLRRWASSPADSPDFESIIDRPPQLVRTGRRRHGPGLLILIAIPVAAFALGTWQVKRLEWKTNMLAKFEDRLVRPPLPLPPMIDPDRIDEFDYRRVLARGRFRHDQEMLVGPRMREGENGYQVITPLERSDGASKILVNRGWISKKKRDRKDRPEGLPQGEVTVEGLLRSPWKKNMFTPENRPDKNEFYFPDVAEMAGLVGAQPVWVEHTMEPDLITAMDREAKGIPIGRPAEVNIKNNHMQYIFTWYGLSAATTVMLYIFLRKPPKDVARRVRQSKEWA